MDDPQIVDGLPAVNTETKGTPVADSAAAAPSEVNVLFRHKTIRRYRIGRFEFKDNKLRILTQRDLDDFYALMEDPNLPKIEKIDIVRVNEEAQAAAESTIIRGPMGSADILTQKSALDSKSTNTGDSAGKPAESADKASSSGISASALNNLRR